MSDTGRQIGDCRHARAHGSCATCLLERIDALENAIRAHRSQKADDRCIEDDDKLYAVLGDGIKCDRRVGDKAAMLKNCERFIERRCEGGTWPTYAALEAENANLLECLTEIVNSGVEFSDERIRYVTLQVSKAALKDAKAAIEASTIKGTA